MMVSKRFLISIIVWLVCGFTMTVFFIVFVILWLIACPFDRQHYFTQKLTWYLASFYVYIYPFGDIDFIDKHKLVKNKACIAVSNHQSLLDILILYHLYAYFMWVSKVENFSIPALGWMMTINGYIRVSRNDPKTFPKMYEGITKALKNNRTVMMFPEGTRSLTGKIGRFKDGAFKSAVENKVSILPIVVYGTGNLLPKNGMAISGKTKIIIKVLDEIPYEKFPSYDPQILKEHVKNIIADELNRIENIA